MKNNNKIYLVYLLISLSSLINAQVLDKSSIVNTMIKVNDYWINQNPDYGDNRWYRAVYYMGNMAMYNTKPDAKYLNYSLGWATENNWSLNGMSTTTFADNHAAGQSYIDLYNLDKKIFKITAIQTSINYMLTTTENNNWYWIDALFMAMPVFSKLGRLNNDNAYFDKMHTLFLDTKNTRQLYNQNVGLWYRDAKFIPPYKTTGGKDSFWSRGNGWVFGALVRTLQNLPIDHANRAEYISVFKKMSTALASLQRNDGFWNVSLVDPTEFGGPETSGTSLFTYGMAWGINNGILDEATYRPIVEKAWNGMVAIAVQENGKLGYVQGRADRPSPAAYDSTTDYGVGVFLLAGSEMYILKSDGSNIQSPYTTLKNIPGIIEAEDYDKGGEGLAYHDSNIGNTGNVYRTDDVDIGMITGEYGVGWTSGGEWLEYSVTVLASGNYDMNITYSSGIAGAKIGASFPDEAITLFSNLDLAQTTSFDDYVVTTKYSIPLTAGNHILRINIDQRGFNIDKIQFVEHVGGIDPLTVKTHTATTNEVVVYPNPSKAGVFNVSKVGSWKVFNLSGAKVLEGKGNKIDLSDFAKGMYTLKTENGVFKLIYQ